MWIILSIIAIAIVAGGLYYALRRPKDGKPLSSGSGGSGSNSSTAPRDQKPQPPAEQE